MSSRKRETNRPKQIEIKELGRKDWAECRTALREKDRDRVKDYLGPDMCLHVADKRSKMFREVCDPDDYLRGLCWSESTWHHGSPEPRFLELFMDSWVGTKVAPCLRQPWYQTTLVGGRKGGCQPTAQQHCQRSPSSGGGWSVTVQTHLMWQARGSLHFPFFLLFFFLFEDSGCGGRRVCVHLQKYIIAIPLHYSLYKKEELWESLRTHITGYHPCIIHQTATESLLWVWPDLGIGDTEQKHLTPALQNSQWREEALDTDSGGGGGSVLYQRCDGKSKQAPNNSHAYLLLNEGQS